jgi:LPXTG-motif cell wall-anchored protein
MFEPRRHAAALLAALLLALPATAQAEPPLLLAQIEDATPTPSPEGQPPLSEEPPTELGGGDDEEPEEEAEEAGGGTDGGNRDDEPAAGGRELPDTGIESGLIALLGIALIASGSGLRLTLRRDGD